MVLDFDGTISTLRCGWEAVMEPLMLEMICGDTEPTEEIRREVAAYIDESTGIQTILQMKWLAQAVQTKGLNPGMPTDPWFYKAEYNRRLMLQVRQRLNGLDRGTLDPSEFLMEGSREFLEALCRQNVKLYVASGTDHPDVVNEATALGVAKYFTRIAGAPVGSENCSKEKVIADLLNSQNLPGEQIAVIGDGKVEIRLGREAGARTIGLASHERQRRGIDQVKRQRLITAGAHVITGDYSDLDPILTFLGLQKG
jgi:phosphoglycolate phosphatase-like HAD superfamily hydrolase